MQNLFNFFTPKIKVYFWTGLWLSIGLIVGLIFVRFIPGIVFSAAVIWSIGLCLLGGLAGFIFAVPKVISNSGGAVTRVAGVDLTTNERQVLQVNNNLTEISDWLTKAIVGVGLIELKEIPPFVLKVGERMAIGVANSPAIHEKISIVCAGIIVYFSTFGFVAGFLIMRLVISDLLLNTNSEDQ